MTIKNLIALACSSHSEEESRTSALAACKALARHEVVLTLPGQAKAEPSPFPSGTPDTDPFSTYTRPQSSKAKPEAPKPPPPSHSKPRARKQDSPFGQRTKHPKEGGPVRMASRYEAWCKGCGAQVKVSETIWWKKGVGVTCVGCGPEALERSP